MTEQKKARLIWNLAFSRLCQILDEMHRRRAYTQRTDLTPEILAEYEQCREILRDPFAAAPSARLCNFSLYDRGATINVERRDAQLVSFTATPGDRVRVT